MSQCHFTSADLPIEFEYFFEFNRELLAHFFKFGDYASRLTILVVTSLDAPAVVNESFTEFLFSFFIPPAYDVQNIEV